jgi:hypothetical protein
MEPQVVVVGSFVQDLTWQCAAFPQAGETVVGTFVTGPGGKGSNQAVAAGRAGARTLFVGAVGRDAFAGDAKKFYRAEGICAHFVEKPALATGTAGILVNASGQNEMPSAPTPPCVLPMSPPRPCAQPAWSSRNTRPIWAPSQPSSAPPAAPVPQRFTIPRRCAPISTRRSFATSTSSSPTNPNSRP